MSPSQNLILHVVTPRKLLLSPPPSKPPWRDANYPISSTCRRGERGNKYFTPRNEVWINTNLNLISIKIIRRDDPSPFDLRQDARGGKGRGVSLRARRGAVSSKMSL
jgi:hypothetical protein